MFRRTCLILGASLLLAACGSDPILVDPAEEEVQTLALGTPQPGHAHVIAVSPAGLVFVAYWGQDPAHFFDLTTGREVAAIASAEQGGPVATAAFAPDGLTLVLGSRDGTLRVYDMPRRKTVRTLEAPSVPHSQLLGVKVAFSKDGKTLAAAYSRSVDRKPQTGTFRFFDTQSWQESSSWECDTYVRADDLAFSPDLDFAADPGRLYCFEKKSWKVLSDLDSGVPAFSPDGRSVAAVTRNGGPEIRIASTGASGARAIPIEARVHNVAFKPDGTVLAYGDDAGVIAVYDEKGERAHAFHRGYVSIGAIATSPDASKLICDGKDGSLLVYDLTEH
jgi:WD40 repeat protein